MLERIEGAQNYARNKRSIKIQRIGQWSIVLMRSYASDFRHVLRRPEPVYESPSSSTLSPLVTEPSSSCAER